MRTITCDNCGNTQENTHNTYLSTLTDESMWLIVESTDPLTLEPAEYQLCSYLCLSIWAANMLQHSGDERPREGTGRD